MRSFRLLNRQTAGYMIAVAGVLLAAFVPALAMAAQVTQRSIELSSSSASSTNVTYTVKFTASNAAGSFVVDFCSNSPVIGEACTAPTGFSVTGVTSATSGFTDVVAPTSASTTQRVVTGTIGASDNVSVVLSGVTNPSVAGTVYARIVTYNTKSNALLYTSSDVTRTGSVDNGGVAMSINNTIGVSGAVLESMTFCVAGQTITANCNLTGNIAPTLKLGEDLGNGVLALTPSAISTGHIFTQLSTNAASGAVINLKSSATGCGGLVNSSNPTACYITPALTSDFAFGTAKFGVKTSTATGTGTNPTGILQPFTASAYNNTTYALNWASGDATGVTSTYGDPFLDTAGLPVNNQNMDLTFGASVTNSTPAGFYSADLGLIATGKF